jgi:type VI secretion system secreted protein VgrG
MSDLTPTQDNRIIRLNVPDLKDRDKLLLESFTGQEGISFSFRYDLSLLSTDQAIPFESVVGKAATITVCLPNDEKRYINGIICSFSQGGTSGTLTAYQAVLVPKLWLTQRVADSRIFQGKKTPEILTAILEKTGIPAVSSGKGVPGYRLSIAPDRYDTREYCVQYSETDFHFLSRLMEDEGLFYYFEHSEDQHTLVITDVTPTALNHSVPHLPAAAFEDSKNKTVQEEAIHAWSMAQEVRPDEYTVRSYDFENPSHDLTASSKSNDKPTREIYDFPERFNTPDWGRHVADLRMEEIEAANTVITGSSICRAFVSGYVFKLTGHYRKDVNNREFLLTTIFHSFKQGDNFCASSKEASDAFTYSNTFSCIPGTARYRPARNTQVPAIVSTQTAIVVGHNTVEENGHPPKPPAPHTPRDQIYTDQYGRVKVRFHWDRSSKNGDTTCFLRTAQPWAGMGWGHQWIPRIGQEVVVTFLEGDPDKPLITGTVYNGDNGLPLTTDKYKTQSGIRTRSNPIDPDAANDKFNMLRFDDKRDCEQVYLRSQKRLDVRALGSYFDTSGGDRNTLIGGKDKDGNQGGDYTLTVGNDADIHINGGLFQKIEKVLNHTVVGDAVFDYEGNLSVLVKTKSETNAKEIVLEALEKISLKVGGSFITIDLSGVTISGPQVKINSGGAGTPCGSPDIDDPLDAAGADTGKPGFVDCSKGGGAGKGKRNRRKLNAQHAPPFATVRLPDGSIKVGNNLVIKPNPADPAFQDKVLRDLTTMSNQSTGMERLNRINNQGKTVNIEYGPVNKTTYDNTTDAAPKGLALSGGRTGTGNGSGSTVQYDPNSEPPTNADPTINRPSDVALNHELAHADMAGRGERNPTADTANPNNGSVHETQVIDQDNQYRDQRVLPDGRQVPRRRDHTVL